MSRPDSASAPPASQRLAALLARNAGHAADPGGWLPTAQEAGLEHAPLGPPCGPASGSLISARLGVLATRLVASASATYGRIGLGSIEARVLLVLGAGPHTSSQLGKVIGIDRAAVCRAVQSLVERDLVHKLEGKARDVRLTPEGARFIEDIERLQAERGRRLLAGFSEAEEADLLGFLGRLMLNVPELVELAESGVFGGAD